MLENIFETIVVGSNTVFLNIPQDDYFLSYPDISNGAAEEITETYFRMRGRDGIPKVVDVGADHATHMIKITLEVTENREGHVDGYKVPDSLNIFRHDENE